MKRKRREGNYTPQKKKNSIQNVVGNKENGYPFPDSFNTMINVSKETSDTLKNSSKSISWKRSLRNSWRTCKTWLTRKYKIHLKNFKSP
jgi:hypothetical protein